MTQVITVTPDGGMSGLQRKPGKGVDLRAFGHAAIERASLVEWDEVRQQWYVLILTGRYAEHKLSHPLRLKTVGIPTGQSFYPGSSMVTGTGVYYFPEYEDAVKAEVDFLDALRLRGVF